MKRTRGTICSRHTKTEHFTVGKTGGKMRLPKSLTRQNSAPYTGTGHYFVALRFLSARFLPAQIWPIQNPACFDPARSDPARYDPECSRAYSRGYSRGRPHGRSRVTCVITRINTRISTRVDACGPAFSPCCGRGDPQSGSTPAPRVNPGPFLPEKRRWPARDQE